MGPDTPIISTISGVQYIANTTVQTAAVATTADSTIRVAVPAGYSNPGGRLDTPPVSLAG